jgi:hypothetical protein
MPTAGTATPTTNAIAMSADVTSRDCHGGGAASASMPRRRRRQDQQRHRDRHDGVTEVDEAVEPPLGLTSVAAISS